MGEQPSISLLDQEIFGSFNGIKFFEIIDGYAVVNALACEEGVVEVGEREGGEGCITAELGIGGNDGPN